MSPDAPATSGRTAPVVGAVIAGGAATRFGNDKAMVPLDGSPLIAHAIAALAPFTPEIVICGRAFGDHRTLADRPATGLGPLAGIAAALADAPGHALVLTIACDMPRVPPALLQALIDAAPSYCADAPILGCWRAADSAALDAHLARGGSRSIRRWAQAIGAQAVDWSGPLANINTPEDLAAL